LRPGLSRGADGARWKRGFIVLVTFFRTLSDMLKGVEFHAKNKDK
jgi:hypothetical protein